MRPPWAPRHAPAPHMSKGLHSSCHRQSQATTCARRGGTHVEADGGHGREHLANVQFVQDGGFARGVEPKTHHTHLLAAEEAIKHLCEHLPHVCCSRQCLTSLADWLQARDHRRLPRPGLLSSVVFVGWLGYLLVLLFRANRGVRRVNATARRLLCCRSARQRVELTIMELKFACRRCAHVATALRAVSRWALDVAAGCAFARCLSASRLKVPRTVTA